MLTRVFILCAVLCAVAFSATNAADHIFLPAQQYYVGDVSRFGGGRKNRHNDVCHDFNGDGVGDVFFIRTCDVNGSVVRMAILQGNPDGSFQPIREIEITMDGMSSTPCGVHPPIVIDYDGNGLDDIMATTAIEGHVYIGLNNGSNSWDNISLPDFYMKIFMGINVNRLLAACDCDGDGIEEFAAGSNAVDMDAGFVQPTMILDYDTDYSSFMPVYMRDTEGLVVWSDAGFGDFNGDGIADLMERSFYSGVRIHAGDGDCQFHFFDEVGTVLHGYSVIGDFNGDGIDDFVHSHEMMTTHASYYARVYFGGNENLRSGPTVTLSNIHFYSLVPLVADINSDGMDDIGIVQYANSGDDFICLYLHYSEGESFSAHCDTLYLPSSADYLAAQREGYNVYGWDFNEDGYDDICYMSAPDTFSVLLNAQTVATELQSFHAYYDEDRGVVLEWKVTGANNGDRFIISRTVVGDAGAAGSSSRKIVSIPAESSVNIYSIIDSDLSEIYGRTARYVLSVEESPIRTRVLGESLQHIPSLQLILHQNFPNPFNPATTIEYCLPENCPVLLEVFDVAGRSIIRLVDEYMEAGDHSVEWNGLDNKGVETESGAYFYRLTAGKAIISRKMILLR